MEFKETERVELKREFNKDNKETIEKEIVAFLNTSGGIIYIGVDDDGTVVGVDRPDDALRWLADIVLHGISPECNDYVALSTIDAEGKKIVGIDIIKGESFYYISRYGKHEGLFHKGRHGVSWTYRKGNSTQTRQISEGRRKPECLATHSPLMGE